MKQTLTLPELYCPFDTPIHRMDARVKLPLALGFILLTALLPRGSWVVYPLLGALCFSATALSGLGGLFLLRRSLLALPFMLAALPLLLTVPGDAWLVFSLAGAPVQASWQGLERFLDIAVRACLSVQAAVILTAVTPRAELLQALRSLRLPGILVSVISLMWRYLDLIGDEALRLLRARTARSGARPQPGVKTGGSLAWRARVTGGMAGSLMLRSFERSERIYAAMLARGYDGELRSLPRAGMNCKDRRALAAGAALFILLFLLSIGLDALWMQ